jgi:alpha-beta hydrolase superfamily lysophospholipase
MPLDEVARYQRKLQDESFRAFLGMLALELPKPERIKSPIYVAGAVNDRIFSTAEMEKLARTYDTGAILFPDMAHDMMLEPGWKSVADSILGWLKQRGL